MDNKGSILGDNIIAKLPSLSISLRLSHDLWTEINQLVENGVFNNISDAIRSLAEGGLWLHKNKDSLQNQEFVKDIFEKWNSKMNEKGIFEWTSQLTSDQLDAIKMALDLEKEKRCKQN